jgi:hypothetical protein
LRLLKINAKGIPGGIFSNLALFHDYPVSAGNISLGGCHDFLQDAKISIILTHHKFISGSRANPQGPGPRFQRTIYPLEGLIFRCGLEKKLEINWREKEKALFWALTY